MQRLYLETYREILKGFGPAFYDTVTYEVK